MSISAFMQEEKFECVQVRQNQFLVSLGRSKKNPQAIIIPSCSHLPSTKGNPYTGIQQLLYCIIQSSISTLVYWTNSSIRDIHMCVYMCQYNGDISQSTYTIQQPELDASEGYSRLHRSQTQDMLL